MTTELKDKSLNSRYVVLHSVLTLALTLAVMANSLAAQDVAEPNATRTHEANASKLHRPWSRSSNSNSRESKGYKTRASLHTRKRTSFALNFPKQGMMLPR